MPRRSQEPKPTQAELKAVRDISLQCFDAAQSANDKMESILGKLKTEDDRECFGADVDELDAALGAIRQRWHDLMPPVAGILFQVAAGLDRPIEVCGKKSPTAHHAAEILLLCAQITVLCAKMPELTVEKHKARIRADLAKLTVDYDGLRAGINLEFGRAIALIKNVSSDDTELDHANPQQKIRHGVLLQRLRIGRNAFGKYRSKAGVPAPGRGERMHEYTLEEAQRMCRCILSHGGTAKVREDAQNVLTYLKQVTANG